MVWWSKWLMVKLRVIVGWHFIVVPKKVLALDLHQWELRTQNKHDLHTPLHSYCTFALSPSMATCIANQDTHVVMRVTHNKKFKALLHFSPSLTFCTSVRPEHQPSGTKNWYFIIYVAFLCPMRPQLLVWFNH